MIYQVAAEAEHCRPSGGGGWYPEEQELSSILNIIHHVGYLQIKGRDFFEIFKYFLEHRFICRPSIPLYRRTLELNPATLAFSVGRSDCSA